MLLLSLYAIAMFGYITATRRASSWGSDAAAERARLTRVDDDVAALRGEIRRIAIQHRNGE